MEILEKKIAEKYFHKKKAETNKKPKRPLTKLQRQKRRLKKRRQRQRLLKQYITQEIYDNIIKLSEASKKDGHYKTGVHKDIAIELDLPFSAVRAALHGYIRYGRLKIKEQKNDSK